MEQVTVRVDAANLSYPLGDLYGVFFEDINHAADGGLYAELVQNRAFEFSPVDCGQYHSLTAYHTVGKHVKVTIEEEEPFSEKNPHYAVVAVEQGAGGLCNEGFHGIPLKKGENYICSVYARCRNRTELTITVRLVTKDETVLAKGNVAIGEEWQQYRLMLHPTEDCDDAQLELLAEGPCVFCLDMLSLFPENTYKHRHNGLRKDLAEAIADLKPKFLRFPGGCLVHDGSLNREDRDALYFWKNTIGPLSERASRRNNWGYNQTLGLGYYEYFLFCEDIGAKPLPVLPAAYNPHRHIAVPIAELDSWIQDALDLIEFANGDETTVWGGVRAELGHKEPFGLQYLAIGNEELFAPFVERFPYFRDAIKAKYPEIQVISSAGPFADGADFDWMWKEADKAKADLVDEHYYMSPEWMLKHYHRYDSYERNGARVFLGEYASLGNKFKNALAEAAYMTGLEQNADKVALACYAPLLCRREYVNWRPDLLWFDKTRVIKTVNYHVQKLFMNHQGAYRLSSALEGGSYERQPLPDISGWFGFESENEEVVFHNICVNGNVVATEFVLRKGEPFALLEQPEAGHLELTFEFTKTKGQKQLMVVFGKTEEGYYKWEIGGWANDMSSVGKSDGDSYGVLTVGKSITLQEQKRYKARLVITGRTVFAEVNGEVYHSFTEPETVIEPLYHCASIEEDGRIYVKAVNVKAEPVTAVLSLEGAKEVYLEAVWHLLASDDLQAENTFENPECVVPEERRLPVKNNSWTTEIPPQSISVFELMPSAF
ncbi:MAG: alpha-L-arabinofuranosidase C-terminal domain-containing protein [Lachnospiraceae bacterium]